MNNHYTGHSHSQTKPNPTHECEKCHVFKLMTFSLPYGKARAQQWSLPMQHSVLVLPSGRNKSGVFSGPHPATHPLLTGSMTCSSSSPHRYLAGLHVGVCKKSCYLQIVKVVVVMKMIMRVMLMLVMMLLVGALTFWWIFVHNF